MEPHNVVVESEDPPQYSINRDAKISSLERKDATNGSPMTEWVEAVWFMVVGWWLAFRKQDRASSTNRLRRDLEATTNAHRSMTSLIVVAET